MEELEEATILEAYNTYLKFINNEVASGKYPQYKAFGMAYIRFSNEEKELFKLLFMRDRTNEAIEYSTDFKESVNMLIKANNITYELAKLIHLEMWICVHGIATMLATSYLPLEYDLISDILTDVYQGIIKKHKENCDECN